MSCGKIVEQDLGWRATLKGSKGFYVTEAALAGVDHRVRATFFWHEGDKLVMVSHAAVGTEQGASLPLAATAAAAEISTPLDASHFGKRRPGAADWTIPFRPTHRFSRSPSSVARMQQRDR